MVRLTGLLHWPTLESFTRQTARQVQLEGAQPVPSRTKLFWAVQAMRGLLRGVLDKELLFARP
jgi:hypothetical protein